MTGAAAMRQNFIRRMSGIPQVTLSKHFLTCIMCRPYATSRAMSVIGHLSRPLHALAFAAMVALPAAAEPTAPLDAGGSITASSVSVAAADLSGSFALTASSQALAARTAPAAPTAPAIAGIAVVLPLDGSVPRPPTRPEDFRVHAVVVLSAAPLRPQARPDSLILTGPLPEMRWDHRAEADEWTRATLGAVADAGLPDVVPADIATWCPRYAHADDHDRAAFWTGLLSALARHESTHNPRAVGGGGLYHGLLQILPSTARQYGCAARTGEELRDGAANLECAVRIAARNVLRDEAVARDNGRNAGLARDWGPMTVASRRAEMAAWTAAQDYCAVRTAVLTAPVPPSRPSTLDPGADPRIIELALLSRDIRELRAVPAGNASGG
jgi:hypothetical protein